MTEKESCIRFYHTGTDPFEAIFKASVDKEGKLIGKPAILGRQSHHGMVSFEPKTRQRRPISWKKWALHLLYKGTSCITIIAANCPPIARPDVRLIPMRISRGYDFLSPAAASAAAAFFAAASSRCFRMTARRAKSACAS